AGCTPPLLAVRQRGAEILKCPAQHLAVERSGEFDFKAAGCGYSIVLRCSSETGEAPCAPAPLPRAYAPAWAPGYNVVGGGQILTAISEPIFVPPPPVQPYRYTPPPPPPP